jgi:hypothetical protein
VSVRGLAAVGGIDRDQELIIVVARGAGVAHDPSIVSAAREIMRSAGREDIALFEADAKQSGRERASFDLVHGRFLLGAIREWPRLLELGEQAFASAEESRSISDAALSSCCARLAWRKRTRPPRTRHREVHCPSGYLADQFYDYSGLGAQAQVSLAACVLARPSDLNGDIGLERSCS